MRSAKIRTTGGKQLNEATAGSIQGKLKESDVVD